MNKDLYFEYIEDFADYIVERVERDEDLFLTVVGKFEEIKNIIKEMMLITDVEFEGIELRSADINGYTDEYALDCWLDDGYVRIGCEPAKRDGRYLDIISDETYLLDNVSSKIISVCEEDSLYFVTIDEECGCDCCECCKCDYCEDDALSDNDDDDIDYLLRVIWF